MNLTGMMTWIFLGAKNTGMPLSRACDHVNIPFLRPT